MADVYLNGILLFVFGVFLGSFLNLVSDRIVKGGKIVVGHSVCDFCGKILKPHNLIPLVSFFFQGRKCSGCRKPLSWAYPLSETLSGLFLILASYVSGFSLLEPFTLGPTVAFIFLAAVFSFYEILILTDLKYFLIPDKIVLPAVGFVAFFQILITFTGLFEYKNILQNNDLGRYLLQTGYFEDRVLAAFKLLGVNFTSALIIGFFFFFLVWVTKGKGMGGGDIRLALLVGVVNPFPYNLLAIFLAFFVGAVVSVLLILIGRKTLKSVVPFGPFLILGSLISLLWGGPILYWYLHLL